MHILISGISGFVGRKLLQHLKNQDFEVYGLVRDDAFSKKMPEVETVKGDLTDLSSLRKAVAKAKPNIIIHLAALTPVRFSFGRQSEYMNVNYLGTSNLIQAVLDEKVRLEQFIHASTAEVYKPKTSLITEEDPLFGSTPYGISKAAADFYVQMAGLAYDLPYTILRPTNTFGRTFDLPEEARGYFVEKAIIQMLTRNTAEFDGLSSSARCWMYREDHVNAYLAVLGRSDAVKQIFNVSPNHPASVGEVVSLIAKLTSFKGIVKWGLNPRPYDPQDLCLDGSKLVKTIGWKPQFTLEKGLEKTIGYWKNVLGSEQQSKS